MWQTLMNRWTAPGFVLNSLPKAGTNLVKKALDLLPGVRDSQEYVWGAKALDALAGGGDAGETVPVGVGWPRPAPVAALAASLDRVGRGRYALWHVPYAEATARLLAERQMRMIVVMRDPRDAALSLVNYVLERPHHRLYAVMEPLSPEERVLLSIRGASGADGGLLDVGTRCRHVLNWTQQAGPPHVHATTFERLVGAQGGGDDAAQRDELAALIAFLGLHATSKQVDAVAQQLFGGTHTFHKGAIGGWREQFTPAHVAAMKDAAGDLLIELGYARDLDW